MREHEEENLEDLKKDLLDNVEDLKMTSDQVRLGVPKRSTFYQRSATLLGKITLLTVIPLVVLPITMSIESEKFPSILLTFLAVTFTSLSLAGIALIMYFYTVYKNE